MRGAPDSTCIYCGLAKPWPAPCAESGSGFHETAAERIRGLEEERDRFLAGLRDANRLLLAGARALAAVRAPGWRRRRKAIAAIPSRPDHLDLETAAAKISDIVAICAGDPSLPVGPTFDELEGRS